MDIDNLIFSKCYPELRFTILGERFIKLGSRLNTSTSDGDIAILSSLVKEFAMGIAQDYTVESLKDDLKDEGVNEIFKTIQSGISDIYYSDHPISKIIITVFMDTLKHNNHSLYNRYFTEKHLLKNKSGGGSEVQTGGVVKIILQTLAYTLLLSREPLEINLSMLPFSSFFMGEPTGVRVDVRLPDIFGVGGPSSTNNSRPLVVEITAAEEQHASASHELLVAKAGAAAFPAQVGAMGQYVDPTNAVLAEVFKPFSNVTEEVRGKRAAIVGKEITISELEGSITRHRQKAANFLWGKPTSREIQENKHNEEKVHELRSEISILSANISAIGGIPDVAAVSTWANPNVLAPVVLAIQGSATRYNLPIVSSTQSSALTSVSPSPMHTPAIYSRPPAPKASGITPYTNSHVVLKVPRGPHSNVLVSLQRRNIQLSPIEFVRINTTYTKFNEIILNITEMIGTSTVLPPGVMEYINSLTNEVVNPVESTGIQLWTGKKLTKNATNPLLKWVRKIMILHARQRVKINTEIELSVFRSIEKDALLEAERQKFDNILQEVSSEVKEMYRIQGINITDEKIEARVRIIVVRDYGIFNKFPNDHKLKEYADIIFKSTTNPTSQQLVLLSDIQSDIDFFKNPENITFYNRQLRRIKKHLIYYILLTVVYGAAVVSTEIAFNALYSLNNLALRAARVNQRAILAGNAAARRREELEERRHQHELAALNAAARLAAQAQAQAQGPAQALAQPPAQGPVQPPAQGPVPGGGRRKTRNRKHKRSKTSKRY